MAADQATAAATTQKKARFNYFSLCTQDVCGRPQNYTLVTTLSQEAAEAKMAEFQTEGKKGKKGKSGQKKGKKGKSGKKKEEDTQHLTPCDPVPNVFQALVDSEYVQETKGDFSVFIWEKFPLDFTSFASLFEDATGGDDSDDEDFSYDCRIFYESDQRGQGKHCVVLHPKDRHGADRKLAIQLASSHHSPEVAANGIRQLFGNYVDQLVTSEFTTFARFRPFEPLVVCDSQVTTAGEAVGHMKVCCSLLPSSRWNVKSTQLTSPS